MSEPRPVNVCNIRERWTFRRCVACVTAARALLRRRRVRFDSSLVVASACAVALGLVSGLVVAVDLVRRRGAKMMIMNFVWPLTALWSGPLGAWAYFRFGRAKRGKGKVSFPVAVGKGATHCGSGCTAGDLVAETASAFLPISIFGHKIFGTWIYDFVLAFAFGIVFQYFTIKPMRHLSRAEGLRAAVKADAFSLTAWQIGMYGWMAIATFAIFHHELPKSSPVFWFMMQIGMLCGFFTSYPVNWILLRKGLKERM